MRTCECEDGECAGCRNQIRHSLVWNGSPHVLADLLPVGTKLKKREPSPIPLSIYVESLEIRRRTNDNLAEQRKIAEALSQPLFTKPPTSTKHSYRNARGQFAKRSQFNQALSSKGQDSRLSICLLGFESPQGRLPLQLNWQSNGFVNRRLQVRFLLEALNAVYVAMVKVWARSADNPEQVTTQKETAFV